MRLPRRYPRTRSSLPLRLERLDDRWLPSAYTVTDLGTLGGAKAAALDINDAGQVVGYAATPTSSQGHAFLWQNGVMTDLGTVGGNVSWANALNNVGQVAGMTTIATGSSATGGFFWDAGVMTGLGVGRSANGINDAGQVVGVHHTSTSYRAYVWDDGVFTDLGTFDFGGGGGSAAYDINNAGQVVGVSSANGFGLNQPPLPPRAVLWQNGTMTNLGVFPGDTESSAIAINTLGQVAGTSEFMDPDTYAITARAFIWHNGVMTDLNVPGAEDRATDINDSGHVVGAMKLSAAPSSQRGFVYKDGVATNLNSLVPAGSGLTITGAWGINNAGQIAASAVDAAGTSHAVVLTPAADTPAVSVNDVTVTEGNTGTQSAAFTVTLSAASLQPVTVNFSTADGTAAGGDYQAASGTLTFAPGQTSQTVAVPVAGDRVAEPNETFVLHLSQATNSTVVGDGQGVGTITDDEPRISISALVSGYEGRKGKTTNFVFTVSLSAPYDQPVTTSFKTVSGTASAGSDFVSQAGTVTFAPGEVTKTITIQVAGDGKREGDEYFYVDLYGASGNAHFGNWRATGSIWNDD
jgi:probable HAF family extracellular repeat protein